MCSGVGSWGTTERGRQSALEEHRLATLGTPELGRGLGLVGLGLGLNRRCWSSELSKVLLQGHQANTLRGSEEAIVPDFHEAFGQDMLQETVDELFGVQGTTCFCAGLGGAVAKGDTIIFQFEDAVVANGDPENVRGQILQGI